eukprot:SAG11_NODE_541_length_8643_cov_21.904963_5_plen_167_part_00
MAIDDPIAKDPPWMQTTETIFAVIFTLEMFVKIISYGLVFGGEFTYLKSGWNILDCTVVITAWMPHFLALLGVDNAGGVTGLRALRVLRPLRSMNRIPAMKTLVESIFLALPRTAALLFIVLLFFIIYGIVAIQLWQEDGPLEGFVSLQSIVSSKRASYQNLTAQI